jgi:hypothetical protein
MSVLPPQVDNSQQINDQLALASIIGILDAWRSTTTPMGYINSFHVISKIRELAGVQPTPTTEATESVLHIAIPKELNLITAKALCDFCNALAEKLTQNQAEYGYTTQWLSEDWQDELHKGLTHHISKGDARDVAIYAMFAWVRGWQTKLDLSAVFEWVQALESYGHLEARSLELVEQVNKGAKTIETLEATISDLEVEVSNLLWYKQKVSSLETEVDSLTEEINELKRTIDKLSEGGSR